MRDTTKINGDSEFEIKKRPQKTDTFMLLYNRRFDQKH